MEPQDAVKLCYQSVYGAEHLLADKENARQMFAEEYDGTAAWDGILFESISSEYFRCHLGAWKKTGLPSEWLLNMFLSTAAEKVSGTEKDALFLSRLNAVFVLSSTGLMPFGADVWQNYRHDYEESEIRPVRHSKSYRDSEKPAYRIVKAGYARLLPLLQKIAALPKTDGAGVIAIDGRAAAGKTTAAALIAEVTDAQVIHMDDFFLPPRIRTKKRLAQIGGNVHYERFLKEVMPFLHAGKPFSYRRFDCGSMTYGENRRIEESEWRIVEGAYSFHPLFAEYMDLRVFCDVPPDEQIKRITARNGEEMATVFAERWIPMEEKYLTAEKIKEKADIIL